MVDTKREFPVTVATQKVQIILFYVCANRGSGNYLHLWSLLKGRTRDSALMLLMQNLDEFVTTPYRAILNYLRSAGLLKVLLGLSPEKCS